MDWGNAERLRADARLRPHAHRPHVGARLPLDGDANASEQMKQR